MKSHEKTYNRLILNIASTICIFESVETFLGIDVSRTYTSWKKCDICSKKKNEIIFNFKF